MPEAKNEPAQNRNEPVFRLRICSIQPNGIEIDCLTYDGLRVRAVVPLGVEVTFCAPFTHEQPTDLSAAAEVIAKALRG